MRLSVGPQATPNVQRFSGSCELRRWVLWNDARQRVALKAASTSAKLERLGEGALAHRRFSKDSKKPARRALRGSASCRRPRHRGMCPNSLLSNHRLRKRVVIRRGARRNFSTERQSEALDPWIQCQLSALVEHPGPRSEEGKASAAQPRSLGEGPVSIQAACSSTASCAVVAFCSRNDTMCRLTVSACVRGPM